MSKKKKLYNYKNLIFLQDGSSIIMRRTSKIKNLRLTVDNYNQNYLLKIENKVQKNQQNTNLFFKKYFF